MTTPLSDDELARQRRANQGWGPDYDGNCPVCGVKCVPGPDGKIPHDQAAHDRRKAEDWRPQKLEGQRVRERAPDLYDPPGERHLPPFVRSLIEKRPDLEAEIVAEYEAGMRRERLPEPQIPLPVKKSDDLELQPPRKVFGYDPAE